MTKLSLSDSLQGIKRRKSPKKNPVPKPVPKPTEKSVSDSKKISVSATKQAKAKPEQPVKVIRQTPKATKQRRSKKTSGISPQKDIFQIQKKIQETQKPVQEPSQPKEPVKKPVQKPSEDRRRRRSRSRSKTRRRSKSRVKDHKRQMQRSRKQTQNSSEDDTEDIETIKQKIQDIRNKKSKYIREHLEKQGVRVSGKSDRLLKDIYFYSTVCNINIRHEQ